MRFAKCDEGERFICRLNHDGDLLDSIKQFAVDHGIEAASFTAIGAVKRAVVSFYHQEKKTYVQEKLNMPLEILSCIGNIARMKGETIVHAHVVLSDDEGRARGGHLHSGTVVFAGEVHITKLKGVRLEREYDSTTGLNLFKL